jgi:hypothetical protein
MNKLTCLKNTDTTAIISTTPHRFREKMLAMLTVITKPKAGHQ